MKVRHNFYSGTSGLNLPVPIAQYPPEFQGKSRLQYYASLFNSLEINSTFYKLPRKATVANWAASVPEHFRFTCKMSKTITHVRGLDFSKKDVTDFLDVAGEVGEKKGYLLAQFPPSVNIEMLDRLDQLLETIAEEIHNISWKLAIEFRDPSWYEGEVYEILKEYDASLVIQDLPKSATPLTDVWGNSLYLRFHGPEPRYRGDYQLDYLQQYAGYIRNWLAENKTVYVYFNNTVGAAFENLQTLNRLVNGSENYLKG